METRIKCKTKREREIRDFYYAEGYEKGRENCGTICKSENKYKNKGWGDEDPEFREEQRKENERERCPYAHHGGDEGEVVIDDTGTNPPPESSI